MEISVIIPSYKPKAYIWECLDSLINQTFDKHKFEIIIILNGCNLPYYKDIKNYIHDRMSDLNVIFIQTDISGVSNARNIGIDTAQGRYITFIDDDDYVSATYLEEMYDIVITGKMPLTNFIAFSDITREKECNYISNLFNKYISKKNIYIMNVRSYFSTLVCKLINKDIIGDHRFNNKYKNGEDSLFIFEISDKIEQITFTSSKAIYYRRHRAGSAVHNKTNISLCIFQIYEYCKIYLTNPLKYNLLFVLSRIFAVLINIFLEITDRIALKK